MIIEDKSDSIVPSQAEELPGAWGSPPEPSFEKQVTARFKDLCSNCGGVDHLRVKMVVPIESGGEKVVTNATLLCRPCSMAFDAAKSGKRNDKKSCNFWVSQELNSRLSNGLKTRNGFTSMGQMVRYLIGCYVEDPGRFDDLSLYQDSRTADVKLNVWVDSDRYDEFKKIVGERGQTITDTLKGLIRMFECGAEALTRGQNV